MNFLSAVLRIGVALFSMFFGSGNLVYPLEIGQQATGSLLFASLGLLLTAVVVPFMGCIAVLVAGGSGERFFAFLGGKGYRLFALVCLGLMGPFGVLARCLTVIHGSLLAFFPSLPLATCIVSCCLLLYATAIYKGKILDILGRWLAPLLLFLLVLVFVMACFDTPPAAPVTLSGGEAFFMGLNQGYQTMDLIAAFFFAGFVIEQLQQQCSQEKGSHNPFYLFLSAVFLAGGVLALIYAGLIFLGGHYALLLQGVAAKSMLAQIAFLAMGKFGAFSVALAVLLACYTTAIVLTTLFADFVHEHILAQQLPYFIPLAATLLIAASVALLDFQGIASFLAPILEISYPFLMVITFYKLALFAFGVSYKRQKACKPAVR